MLSGTLTIPAALARACRWYARHTALIEGERSVTYGDLDAATRRVAGALQAMGVVAGERVVYLSEPSTEHAIAYYGAQRLGAVTANLHERETVEHLRALLERLDARVLFHSTGKDDIAYALSKALPHLRPVRLGPSIDGAYALDDMMTAAPLAGQPDVRETDPAIIQLSSGSTGQPKALVHSHASVLHTWHGGLHMWRGIESHDRYLNAFSTSFSVWLIHAGAFLNQGGTVVLQPRWDPVVFLEAVARHRITCAALTPTQWRAVLQADPGLHDLSSLRMAAYLGEKLAPEHLMELTERVCRRFNSFYGMSECLGLGGCVIRSEECQQGNKWGSVGLPTLNSDLRVVPVGATTEAPCATGEIGEVVVRSPSFADGNWGDPGWRDRVLTPDGWYRSGDLGYVDEDGYLYLTGRVDNVISTGGIKVTAEEIEQVIETHPDVANVVVLGRPDAQWGERIVAAVVPRSASLTAEDLDRWCEVDGRLARFKRPREWRLFGELPVNSANKRDRRAVAALWTDAP